MASLLTIKDSSNGARYGCQIFAGGKRRTIGLGRCTDRQGRPDPRIPERFVRWVSELERVTRLNSDMPSDLQNWLAGLPDRQHSLLVECGLAKQRRARVIVPSLEGWVGTILAQRQADHSERTRELYATVRDSLTAHMGAGRLLTDYTPGVAQDWRAALAATGKSEPTLRMYARIAKAFFNAAVDQEIIDRNPFRKLPSASMAATRDHYVSPEKALRILDELPTFAHRVVFALARFGGLRIPSELAGLTWPDIDWSAKRMRVTAPKTRRTKPTRKVPIGPELETVLQEAFDRAPEGSTHVVTLSSAGSLHKTIRAAAERAGVELWDDLFQTLRRNRETDWLNVFPAHVVSEWMGHSVDVQQEHYAQVLTDHFAQAASTYANGVQRTDKHPLTPTTTEPTPEPANAVCAHSGAANADDSSLMSRLLYPLSYGAEDAAKPESSEASEESAEPPGTAPYAESLSDRTTSGDSDLAAIVAVWPGLSRAVRTEWGRIARSLIPENPESSRHKLGTACAQRVGGTPATSARETAGHVDASSRTQ